MKKIYLFLVCILTTGIVLSQTYTATNGTTTYTTCSGTFYDSGGAGGSYGNNENSVTTFCGTAGQCVRLNFTQLNLRNNDILTIHDGPTTASPQIAGFTNTSTAPGTFTATSGCITVWFTSNASQVQTGWTAAISCTPCPTLADYTHPTVGINNEYVGSCLVSDCGPFTYADNGNTTGNYSTSINNVYRVFCPNTAGQCMQVTFNSFNMEAGWDYLLVKNGPTQNSTTFTTAPASATNYAGVTGLTGNLSASVPFSYTSTDPSGCLTFRCYSDGTATASGWNATLQCIPCAGGPNGTDPNDCINMVPLCSSAAVPGDATGPGIVAEGCTGSACPAGGENHSIWYTIQAQTSGTIDITITPTNPADDYDFAVYGPNASCGALGAPLRCTDAGTTGVTGTGGDTDNTETVLGNGQLASINAIAGQTFIIVVDEWSPNLGGTGFTMSFGGTASLDCTILPIELTEFNANYIPDEHLIDLHWITASEENSDRFEVERSFDGENYEVINTVKAQENSTLETQYYVVDQNPKIGYNYYRLNLFDLDGSHRYSEVRAVNILDDAYDLLSFNPNPTTGKTEVIFNSYRKEEVALTVYSYDGKPVVRTSLNATKGGNRFDLDLTNVDGNMFFVTITTSDKVYSGKLVKN